MKIHVHIIMFISVFMGTVYRLCAKRDQYTLRSDVATGL